SADKIHSLGGHVDLRRGKLTHFEESPPAKLPKTFYVPGAAFLINQGAWKKLGGFDESLGNYWEDVDLSLRASKAGIRLGVNPGIILRHGVGKTCGGDPLYSVYYFQRNRRRVSLRHGQGCDLGFFTFNYSISSFIKLYKYMKNKDFYRAKLLL